jgi:DNA-binding beta-propeller fold protein YncE
VGARGVVVSADNKNVYVASEGNTNGNSALAVFSRDTTTGALTQLPGPAGCFAVKGDGVTCGVARGLVTAIIAAVSSDGNNVYVAARDSNSLAVFSRNTTTGALTQLSGPAGCVAGTGGDPTCAAGRGLNQVVFVSVSPDGSNVYAAAHVGNALTIFSRDATTGALTQLSGLDACVSSDGTAGSCAIGTALDGAISIKTSLDGKNVYATAYVAGAVVTFNRMSR